MTAQVVETGASSLVRSPGIVGALSHKRVRIPRNDAEYLALLTQCNGDCYEEDCAFCIKFALEKVEEFDDATASEFLKSIPSEIQKIAVDAINRLEYSLLPATVAF